MYGGHIVEDWDRRLANAYLYKYFNEQLLEGMEMFPNFSTPPNTFTHKQVYFLFFNLNYKYLNFLNFLNYK